MKYLGYALLALVLGMVLGCLYVNGTAILEYNALGILLGDSFSQIMK